MWCPAPKLFLAPLLVGALVVLCACSSPFDEAMASTYVRVQFVVSSPSSALVDIAYYDPVPRETITVRTTTPWSHDYRVLSSSRGSATLSLISLDGTTPIKAQAWVDGALVSEREGISLTVKADGGGYSTPAAPPAVE